MAYQDVYITDAGDMWDLISYRVYGSEQYVTDLIQANPDLRDIAVFSAGVQIVCPDIPVTSATPLPPWRQ